MRLLLTSLAALALAAGTAGAASRAQSQDVAPELGAPVFVVTGGGYGHGVGMSQYGAFAQARDGRTFDQILAAYYPGTTLGKGKVTKVRVLLREAVAKSTVSSTVPFRVRDSAGTVVDLPAGPLELTPKLEVLVDGAPTPTPLVPPLRVLPGKGAPLALGAFQLRGELRVEPVEPVKTKIRVVNVIALDAYLRGVVPGEMPSAWPLEALKAQAVAARTYALSSLLKDKPFDLYPDVRSQVYRGIAGEAPSTTQAVTETAGLVLSFGGALAKTFYHSSSGGRLASSKDVFGLELPYLPTQPDPWDAVSPHHRWPPKTFTAAAVRKALALPAPVADVEAPQTPSGRPSVVRFLLRDGAAVEAKPTDVRFKLGLRSTAFRFGVLRLQKGPLTTAAGEPLRVVGLARGVAAPVLEQLVAGSWVPVQKIKPVAGGSFEVSVSPTEPTRYRLSANGLPGPVVNVTSGAHE